MKKLGILKTYSSNEIDKSYVSIGFETLDRDLIRPEKCYDLLSKTGVKYARCQTGWAKCEKEKGVYDFAWLDEVVDNLHARGIVPWFNVGYGNPIYMHDAPSANATCVGCVPIYYGEEVLDAWRNYIEALTQHFKDRITYFEIWNEPDLLCFWYPKNPSSADYAKFASLTAEVIKANFPDAKVGICVSTPYCFDFIEDALSSLTVKELAFFAFHAYSGVPEYRYPEVIAHIRASLDKHGFDKTELWQSEAGFPSWAPEGHGLFREGCDGERAQAVFQLRRYFLDVYYGVKLSSFFQIADMWEKTYAIANEVMQRPAAHGILNGITYTPKQSYKTITSIGTIFGGEVNPTREYMQVDIPTGNILEVLSARAFSFNKNGYPMYAYYLALDVASKREDIRSAELYITKEIKNPVLIDPYTHEVFELDVPQKTDWRSYVAGYNTGLFRYSGLPLKIYPLIITDKDAFKIEADGD